jgi:hypothetical protein
VTFQRFFVGLFFVGLFCALAGDCFDSDAASKGFLSTALVL